jgi:transposase InsO family protein
VLLDIFSRYVVGWLVAEREDGELAARLNRRELCQTRRRAGRAYGSFRPRLADEGQTPGALAGRPRRGPQPEPAAGL